MVVDTLRKTTRQGSDMFILFRSYDEIYNCKQRDNKLTSPNPWRKITADLPLQFWLVADVDMAATRDEVVPANAAADRMTLRVIDSMYTDAAEKNNVDGSRRKKMKGRSHSVHLGGLTPGRTGFSTEKPLSSFNSHAPKSGNNNSPATK